MVLNDMLEANMETWTHNQFSNQKVMYKLASSQIETEVAAATAATRKFEIAITMP